MHTPDIYLSHLAQDVAHHRLLIRQCVNRIYIIPSPKIICFKVALVVRPIYVHSVSNSYNASTQNNIHVY